MTSILPPNWSWVKLGDVCEINPKLNAIELSNEIEVSFLPMKAVEELTGNIHLTDERKYGKVKKGYTFFGEGDVIFAKITPCMENGKVAITTRLKNGIGFGSTEFHVLRPRSNLLNTFLFFYLIQSSYRRIAQRNMTGTAGQLRVPKRFIEESEIPLPPLPEQKKIVEKIEELFSGLDNGVASLKKAKEQIKLYRQSVLAFAFSGRFVQEKNLNHDSQDLKINRINSKNKSRKSYNPINPGSDNLPDGWKWVKLGEATLINPKLPFERIQLDTIVSFLPMRQVEELTGRYDLSLERKYSEVKKGFTPFTNGDVIFAKITPCMENGKIAVLSNLKNKIGFGSTEFHVFRTKAELLNSYLFYFLIQDTFRAKAQHNMTGAVGQKRVPKRLLEESEIPLSPINQQAQIVEEIESRFAGSEALEKAIDESLIKSETLRQSILKNAFEGKIIQ